MTGFETQVINELAVLKLYRAVSKTPHLNVIPSLDTGTGQALAGTQLPG